MRNMLRYATVLSAALLFFASEGRALVTVDVLDILRAQDVEIVDGLAYVAGGFRIDPSSPTTVIRADLWVIDVSDPAAPVVLSSIDTPGWANDVEVVDGLAYVAGDALRIIDVSNPAAPVEVGSIDVPGSARAVDVVGGLAYVMAGDTLRVIDISNPEAPFERGSLPLLSSYERSADIEVVDGVAYVAVEATGYPKVGFTGLRVIDVSNPAAPIEQSTIDILGNPSDVEVEGGLAYVAVRGFPGWLHSLRVFDVSNPAAPAELGALHITLGPVNDVEIVGGLAYVASGGIRVIDVSNPAAPVELNALATPCCAEDIEVAGGLAYVLGDDLRLIDVSNLEFPLEVSLTDILGYATNLEVLDGLAYVVGDALRVIDVSNPAAPVQLGSIDLPDLASDVEVVDELAYVVGDALRVIDVSNPAGPVELGAIDLPHLAIDVEVAEGLAYVAVQGTSYPPPGGFTGLRVIDVSNPAAPVELGALDTPGDGGNVEVAGWLAYLMDDYSPWHWEIPASLRVIDASNPAAPVELGSLPHPNTRDRGGDVAVVGDLAYVANQRELRVIDVSNPAAPVELSALRTETGGDVEVVDGLAYVAGGFGLWVIDVSNLEGLFDLGAVSSSASGPICAYDDFEVANGLAYALCGSYLRIIDFGPEYRTGIAVEIDIKPGSCPNSWNRNSNGVLPVAILGTDDFDVTQIDVSSVTISRGDGTGGSVGPNEGPPGPHSVFEDVGTPFEGEVCGCHEAEGDGILDLSMKFKTRDVADLLPVDDPSGALVPLVVSGTLLDGTAFTSASDCVRLVPPGSLPNQVNVESAAGSWIDATPLDNQLDGGGFGSFQRTYPHTTVLTLTAPSSHNGNPFVAWKLDGGELIQRRSFTLVVNNPEHTAKAVFKKANGCGLGFELALLLPPLMWLHCRRRRTRA